MIARGLAAAVALTSCYQPTVHPGAPCAADGTCPSGLTCRADTCVEPGTDAADAGDTGDVAADAALRPWATPTPVPGVDSTSTEDDPSFTADRLTMVFTSDRPGGLGMTDIYLGTRASTNDAFAVTEVTAVNSAMVEQSPEISADGRTLYFTSTRNGSNAVFMSSRQGNAWSVPIAVPELAAITGDDVAVSPDGLTALGIEFTNAGNKLVRAVRSSTSDPFGTLVELTELEITTDLAAPTLTNDAAIVYFHAGTTRDIYRAELVDGHYTTPVPVTELNSPGRDAAPFVSASDDHIMFNRDGELMESTR
jgi:hypothetical protein